MRKRLIAWGTVFLGIAFLFGYSSMAWASDLDKFLKLLNQPRQRPPAAHRKNPKGYLDGMVNEMAVTRQIERKSRELERRLQKVFMKIRAYQAIDGAIWVNLGRSYSSLLNDMKAFETTGGGYTDQFIENTREKRTQQMELISHVTLDTASGITDAAETISMNRKKNQNLRAAVKQFIATHQLVGVAFQSAINAQNTALDGLLAAYMDRLSQITSSQLVAAKIYQDISYEFQAAEAQMRAAINTFNQEGALVTVNAAKHLDKLYAMGRELNRMANAAKGDWTVTLYVLPKIPPMLQELNRLSLILGKFQRARQKLARESVQIRQVCEASAFEIYQSSLDIQQLGTTFQSMWDQQVTEIRRIAAQRKVQVKDLAKVIQDEKRKNESMAAQRSVVETRSMQQMADKAFGGPVFN
jgi:hypothetical protein